MIDHEIKIKRDLGKQRGCNYLSNLCARLVGPSFRHVVNLGEPSERKKSPSSRLIIPSPRRGKIKIQGSSISKFDRSRFLPLVQALDLYLQKFHDQLLESQKSLHLESLSRGFDYSE